ncbi:unnamed protein product, partial [Adineta steineri]
MENAQSNNSNRHPPHLRGKAIGMWYAQHRRSNNGPQASSQPRPSSSQPVATIELSANEIQRVTEVRQLFNHHQQPPPRKHFKES